MKDVLNWCIAHYRLIFDVVCILVVIIVAIVKRRPVNSIITCIWLLAVEAVNAAEVSGLKGQAKLEKAISYIRENLKNDFPDIDFNRYYFVAKKAIEDILTTPQKK